MPGLTHNPFRYTILKQDRVQILYENRTARTLRGAAAVKFLDRVEGLNEMEAQRLMAIETGQFKFGNE